MSGDVQPRKRKDKKKRKDDGDPIPEKPHVPIFTNNSVINEDVNIHVHKEGGTGGGICAKLVFFILFSALAVLIGLIITEHRGLTDLETVDPNSKFSQLFEGWVDSNSHDDHDDHNLDSLEGDDHDDDHDEHEDVEEEEHADDDEDHDEETEDVEQSEEEDDEQLEHAIEDEDEDDEDDTEQDEEINDNDDEEDEQTNFEEDETVEETKEDDEIVSKEDEDDQNEDDDQENDEDDSQEENEEDDENESAEVGETQQDEDEDDTKPSREKRDISEEKLDDDDDNEDDNDDEDQDQDDNNDEVDDQDQDSKENDDDTIDADEYEKKTTELDADGVSTDDPVNKADDDSHVETKSKRVEEKETLETEDESTIGSSSNDKSREKQDSDSDRQSEDNDYEYRNVTNKEDLKIRKDIDEAHSSIKNNTSNAIALFDKILQKFPSSPRSLYGKALALDLLADQKRSNEILEKALQLYVTLLKTDSVPIPLFLQASERCINRMRFLGQYRNALTVHKMVINKFPDNPKHLNDLAVTYLTVNRIEEARTVLKQVLATWPENGFALVHYGFILKTTDNALEKAVRYLKKGINTKDEGVIDGRFYFHLGDALVRLGHREEAEKVYEDGTKNKVFFSKYQRSLYNVPRLSGKSWWNLEDLPYSKSINLLRQSWKQIREEGLSLLSEKGYFQDESENLRDTGEWKQFELYARGQKNVNNCKKCPFTCSIINQITEAKSCKRGQTKFSVMHPGTHIWPHCGPTNCRLRVHLGLKVPSNTFLRVADEIKSWKEGEIFIFDDSFEHEVWHNGTDLRLILIVDVWHPELTPYERNSLSPI